MTLVRICRQLTVRRLHSSPRPAATSYFDFMRRFRPKQDQAAEPELTKEEKEELELAKPEEARVEARQEEESPVLLEHFTRRLSALEPRFAENVEGLDASGVEDGLYEIGIGPEPAEPKQYKIGVWKKRTGVYEKAKVAAIAELVVGEQLKQVEIEWPQPFEANAAADPYEAVLDAHEGFKLDGARAAEFSLKNIHLRFQVVKRMIQLTGRDIPDSVFTRALTVNDLLTFYAFDAQKHAKYGLFQEDPYNPYLTKLYIDPKKYEGTNVKVV